EELGRVIAATPLLRNERVPEPDGAEGSLSGLKRGLRLPIRGVLANRFGAQRPSGGPSWKGLFIRSPSGQEVRAVASGRVVFAEVFGAIKSSYVEPVEDKKLITEAISGMLTGLDPHSAYLDQDAFRELQVGTQGQFGGLGIEVGMEEGFVKVVSPIEDTPAFRAGLKPGDFIIKIDDTSVKGMTLNDAVKRMRG